MSDALGQVCKAQQRYSWVLNGRFKGGYITRAYGQPAQGVEAVQLELAQHNYMDESLTFAWQPARASQLQPVLQQLIGALLAAGKR